MEFVRGFETRPEFWHGIPVRAATASFNAMVKTATDRPTIAVLGRMCGRSRWSGGNARHKRTVPWAPRWIEGASR